MSEEYLFCLIGLAAVVGLVAWLTPRLRTGLPDPHHTTLRRPVVDPRWRVGRARERTARRVDRRQAERRNPRKERFL